MRKRLLAAPSVLPGLALTAGVDWLGLSASVWVGQDLLGFEKSPISGIMLATVIGMVVGNVVRLRRYSPTFKWVEPTVDSTANVNLGTRNLYADAGCRRG